MCILFRIDSYKFATIFVFKADEIMWILIFSPWFIRIFFSFHLDRLRFQMYAFLSAIWELCCLIVIYTLIWIDCFFHLKWNAMKKPRTKSIIKLLPLSTLCSAHCVQLQRIYLCCNEEHLLQWTLKTISTGKLDRL